jgi:hypothetical protein
MSLKNSILYLIKSQGEISINELEDLCREENYKISNYERRARELTNEGQIEPIMAEAKSGIKYITAYRSL